MEQLRQRRFTTDEFIAWALEQPTGRYELSNGVVVGMAPERAGHTRTKLDAAVALRLAVRTAGLDCEVFTDGMTVRVDDRTAYEPDALVRCGTRTPDEDLEATDPVVVVEVVSPSSRGIDSGAKLVGYFSLPSVRHYLILDTDKRVVIHHHRDGKGEIGVQILGDGRLSLDPPGLAIDVGDLFRGI